MVTSAFSTARILQWLLTSFRDYPCNKSVDLYIRLLSFQSLTPFVEVGSADVIEPNKSGGNLGLGLLPPSPGYNHSPFQTSSTSFHLSYTHEVNCKLPFTSVDDDSLEF